MIILHCGKNIRGRDPSLHTGSGGTCYHHDDWSLVILMWITWVGGLCQVPLKSPFSGLNLWNRVSVQPTLRGGELSSTFWGSSIYIYYLELFWNEYLSLLPYLFVCSIIYLYINTNILFTHQNNKCSYLSKGVRPVLMLSTKLTVPHDREYKICVC